MIKYRLQQLLSAAKHWGGMAGVLSLVVVVRLRRKASATFKVAQS
jgi:hypothetical protein